MQAVGEISNSRLPSNKERGGDDLAPNILTITLTADQQKQIKDATGRSVSELRVNLTAKGSLSDTELDEVAGGAVDAFIWF